MKPLSRALIDLFKGKPSTPVALTLLGLVAFALTMVLTHSGVLQGLEFHFYDFFIRERAKAASVGPIVLVEMVESDIQNPALDYPLPDDKLAQLLGVLESDSPAVVGVDIWRDLPVPKNGTGLAQLNGVLQSNANITAIFTLDGIQPPPVLKSNPERIAFNDNFPVDVGVAQTIPNVRRTLLFADLAPGESYDSLPFHLALTYLQTRGITPEADARDPAWLSLGKSRLRRFQPNDGLYVNADAKGWQILLDFKCPENFIRFSVSDALGGRIPAGTLRDKIVLLGINAPSVEDARATPIRRTHRGIEVQAMTVNQLLRHALDGEKPLSLLSDRIEDAWVLFWCLVGAAVGARLRATGKIAFGTSACLAALPGLGWLAFSAGWWIPIVAPALGFAGASSLSVAYASSHERKMRSILMKLYSRQVSKEIAEEIWANRESFLDGQKPLAQKLLVTVLFTDLKGFSTISEKMEPAVLYEWLNGYLGAMAQIIQAHGGVLKQFAGDGILALFGVPVPHTTRAQQAADAQAAVSCAVGMGRRLVELVRQWEESGLPAVSMRAGIYTGDVAAGSLGSDERFEYTVVGDVVNTAARLESYDKSFADPDLDPLRSRILIGGPTYDLLDGSFRAKEVGLIEVKGKVNKVPVFQVFGT